MGAMSSRTNSFGRSLNVSGASVTFSSWPSFTSMSNSFSVGTVLSWRVASSPSTASNCLANSSMRRSEPMRNFSRMASIWICRMLPSSSFKSLLHATSVPFETFNRVEIDAKLTPCARSSTNWVLTVGSITKWLCLPHYSCSFMFMPR